MANNYPIWWDQTITVYNKYEDSSRAVTWYRTVLTDCFWKYSHETVLIGSTSVSTNQTVCRVPINPNFKEKFEWDQLSDIDKSQYFTFGPGDIVVKGEVDDVVDEYTAGHRSSDLVTKYKKLQGCIVIDFCTINTGPGRGNEHYRLREQ